MSISSCYSPVVTTYLLAGTVSEILSFSSVHNCLSLSFTVPDILLIIFQNLKTSRDRDHAHLRDYLSIRRLIHHIANQCTKFEVSSINHSRDILG